MKNVTWRRTAIILGVIIIAAISFGVGCAMGAIETAEFLIDEVVRVMKYKEINIDITRVELFEYFIKLKGGK